MLFLKSALLLLFGFIVVPISAIVMFFVVPTFVAFLVFTIMSLVGMDRK